MGKTKRTPEQEIDIINRWRSHDIIFIIRQYFKSKGLEVMDTTQYGNNLPFLYDTYMCYDQSILQSGTDMYVSGGSVPDSYLYIVVHYPEIKIENSIGDSIDVENLYMAIVFKRRKFIGMAVLTANYTYAQAECGYMFSHVPPINLNAGTPKFLKCCLGDSILANIVSMMSCNDNIDLSTYLIIAQNCDFAVHVESTSRAPYIKIKNVETKSSSSYNYYILNVDTDFVFDETPVTKMLHKALNEIILSGKNYVMITKSWNEETKKNDMYFSKNMPLFHRFVIDLSERLIRICTEQSLIYGDDSDLDVLKENNILIKCTIEKEEGFKFLKKAGLKPIKKEGLYSHDGEKIMEFNGNDVVLEVGPFVEPKDDNTGLLVINERLASAMYTIYCKTQFN